VAPPHGDMTRNTQGVDRSDPPKSPFFGALEPRRLRFPNFFLLKIHIPVVAFCEPVEPPLPPPVDRIPLLSFPTLRQLDLYLDIPPSPRNSLSLLM